MEKDAKRNLDDLRYIKHVFLPICSSSSPNLILCHAYIFLLSLLV